MSNLRLINETTASSVASVSVTDVFTSDFDIYKMTILYDNSAGNVVRTQMINSSGSDVTASNYDWAILQMRSSGSFQEQRATSDDDWRMSYEGTAGWNVTTYLMNPFSSSSYTFCLSQSSGYYGASGLTNLNLKMIGTLKQTASMTGIKFTTVGSNFDDFTCRIYGLRVDS
jgi:hypothetical protein